MKRVLYVINRALYEIKKIPRNTPQTPRQVSKKPCILWKRALYIM